MRFRVKQSFDCHILPQSHKLCQKFKLECLIHLNDIISFKLYKDHIFLPDILIATKYYFNKFACSRKIKTKNEFQ